MRKGEIGHSTHKKKGRGEGSPGVQAESAVEEGGESGSVTSQSGKRVTGGRNRRLREGGRTGEGNGKLLLIENPFEGEGGTKEHQQRKKRGEVQDKRNGKTIRTRGGHPGWFQTDTKRQRGELRWEPKA